VKALRPVWGVPASALLATALLAQTVTLPDTSYSTTANANVSEQAQVTVPANIAFPVTDIASSTAASAASVTVGNIVLATSTKQLKISIEAGAASFTPPLTGAATWSAGDVTWNAATWTNATGGSGTLASGIFSTVATCAANAASCSTAGLVFTLGAKTTVKRSGNHSLTVIWKFESIGN